MFLSAFTRTLDGSVRVVRDVNQNVAELLYGWEDVIPLSCSHACPGWDRCDCQESVCSLVLKFRFDNGILVAVRIILCRYV